MRENKSIEASAIFLIPLAAILFLLLARLAFP